MGFKPPVEVLRNETHFVDSYGHGTHYLIGRRTFDGKRGRSLYVQDETGVASVAAALASDNPSAEIEDCFRDFIDTQPLEDMFS